MITGVVLARDEERHIAACLKSLRPHVDELLLIDMQSKDATVSLAEPLVDRVLSHPLVSNFDIARNLANDEARHPWVWLLDADERVPAQTGEMVRNLIRERGHEFSALWIPFKTHFCGKWIEHCGWWPGYTMPRVLKRGCFRFLDVLHAPPEIDGRHLYFPADPSLAIEHYSYESIEHYFEKFNRYTSAEARNLYANGQRFDWKNAVRAMVRDWWTYYEGNQGWEDGAQGWILSWLGGQYRWASQAKLLDEARQAGAPLHGNDVPAELDSVVRLIRDELFSLRASRPRLPLGILWRSPIWDPSGYSVDSRDLVKALATGGRDLALEEIRWSDRRCDLGRAEASLLHRLSKVELDHSFVAVTMCIPSLCAPDPRAALNIIRATFETDRIPETWRDRLAQFDEVWVLARSNRDAFRRGWIPPEKIRVVQGCIDTDIFRPRGPQLKLPEAAQGRFVFLSVLDWQLRKGWDVLVRAFCEEFAVDDQAALLMKISRVHGHALKTVYRQIDSVLKPIGQSLADRPDLIVWDTELTQAEMAGLYRSVDAFALVSRGEGWGRPYLEAMASGLPTIGTAASGQLDFMTADNSYLIPATLVDVPAEAGREIPVFAGHRWYEPDKEALRRTMRVVFSDAPARKTKGRRAVADVRADFGLATGQRRIEEALAAAERRLAPPTPQPVSAGQIRVEIEGELFARHSFSVINETLCRHLGKLDDIALSMRQVIQWPTQGPEEPDAWTIKPFVGRELPSGAQVTIRHAFPPRWTPRPQGKWVHIQPWEFGALPRAWLEPLQAEVDEIWAPSNYVRQVYLRSGVDAKKVHVIPWGINPAVFEPTAPPLVLPTDKSFRLLFVGGAIARKGFDQLLEAYAAEFSSDDDVSLVVKDMGTSTVYRPSSLHERIRELQANPKAPEILYFDTYLTPGQLASLYTSCHCFAAPYRGEGFGLPIIEAMACGLPAIVPRGGPTDDFITPQTGYLLPSRFVECEHPWRLCGVATELSVERDDLRRALRHAAQNPVEVADKGKRASQFVRKRFTWRQSAAAMRKRLKRLVKSEVRKTATRGHSAANAGQQNADRPQLSMCMIARDSARTIGAALESIRPWVDEMIVVDTGSLDNTREIARDLGSRVFEFPWCDDFAAARNASLEHAQGQWIFWMDSDDTIDETNGRRLRELPARIDEVKTMGVIAQVHCPGPSEHGAAEVTAVDHVKLIRNRPDLRFEGRIHEQILPAIRRADGQVAWSDVFVVHSGSDYSAQAQQRKRERDLRLLQLELGERPTHPFTLFNLGMTYADAEDFEQAITYLRQSIANASESESHLRKAYALLVHGLRRTEQTDEAWAVCQEGLARFPDDPELLFRSGVLLHEQKRLEEAAAAYRKVLIPQPRRHFSSVDVGIFSHKARQNLAAVYVDMNNLRAAEGEWRTIVEELPNYHLGWRGLGDCLLRQDKFDEAKSVAERLLAVDGKPQLTAEGLLLRASVVARAGNVDDSLKNLRNAADLLPDDVEPLERECRVLFERGEPTEAERSLRELVERDPSNAPAWHNLASILCLLHRLEQAIECYQKSLQLRPRSADTLVRLGHAFWHAGKTNEAITTWERCMREHPEDVQAHEALERAGVTLNA